MGWGWEAVAGSGLEAGELAALGWAASVDSVAMVGWADSALAVSGLVSVAG